MLLSALSIFSIGRGKYFKTACSRSLHVSSAAADCSECMFIGLFLHANGGDDVESNG
jgi:hypothetical protein